ncbi:hypothetical protein AR275_11660 [Stenotrophomonas maltophilia]|nr:hypothetical protein AR275_11660 [Stenotrophomonas maltophilia]
MVAILEHDEGVCDRRWHGVGRYLCCADLCDNLIDLGELLDGRFKLALHADGLRQTSAGNAQRVKRNITFVQIRNELSAHATGQKTRQYGENGCTTHNQFASTDCPFQHRAIQLGHAPHSLGFLLRDLARDKLSNRSGNEREGQCHRTSQRDNDGQGHRVEHLSFHAGERKDRDVDGGNDEQAEQAGLDHLGTGAGGQSKALIPGQQTPQGVLTLAEAAQTVLNNDDRAVDDQTEVQRTQAHQIC